MATAGGNKTTENGSVSFTIGQSCYSTKSGSYIVQQGVQQAYSVKKETNINNNTGIIIYPNPAVESITLEINNYNLQNLSYYLYSSIGELIAIEKIESIKTNIDMSKLSVAAYFLILRDKNTNIEEFKILKIK